MSTYIPITVETVELDTEQPSLTYRLDFNRGRITGRVDGIEAVAQAIHKALITPRFKCLIYDNQYGSDIQQAMTAGGTTPEYIEAELPRMVEDALSVDSRILEISGFAFEFTGEAAHISFTAITVFGDTKIEEVIL